MSNRQVELFLFDIIIAIVKIKKITSSFTSAYELYNNFIFWDAVIREFEIIGEAVNKVIKAGLFSENRRDIVDFRNVLIHGYFGINPELVWDVIVNDIDDLYNETIEIIMIMDSQVKKEIIEDLIEENKHISFVVEFLKDLLE